MEQPPEFVKKLERFADRLKDSAFKLKPQPTSDYGTSYGGFQRRMIAATIDTFIFTLTIFPLSFYLTNLWVGQVNMDVSPLYYALREVENPELRREIIQQFFVSEGRLEYFNTNTTIQMICLYLYCAIFWKHFAATPGKMLVRLVVLDAKTGQPLSYIASFWRCMGYVVGGVVLCLGVVWIVFDKRRQGWHDKLANSIVIVKPKQMPTQGDNG